MKSDKIFKLSKTVVFFGLLFIVLQGILSLQPSYTKLLKSFYGTDITIYVGLAVALIGWLFWEISIAKRWIVALIISVVLIIAAIALINGIIGCIGAVIGFTGMILFYLNKRELLTFSKPTKKGEF